MTTLHGLRIDYLTEFQAANGASYFGGFDPSLPRWRDLVLKYAWAVPSAEAIATIASHSPLGVVEIGAGGGYWAMLLQQAGVDTVAYDPAPPPGNSDSKWHGGRAWTEVLQGDHTAVIGHPDRTLLLCWPCYDEPHGANAVDLYGGDTVVYVGEGPSGCTGDRRLHQLLGFESSCWCWETPCECESTPAVFQQVAEVEIPQWDGIHDRLTVHRRIGATP